MDTTNLSLAIRQGRALDVIRLRNTGLTKEAACAQIGISTDAFDRIVASDPEAMLAMQTTIDETSREMIVELISARARGLKELIDDMFSPLTKPLARLQIYKHLTKELDTLVDQVRLESGDTKVAEEILSGPVLTRGTSRFAVQSDGVKTTITIETPPVEIVDGTFIDENQKDPDNLESPDQPRLL